MGPHRTEVKGLGTMSTIHGVTEHLLGTSDRVGYRKEKKESERVGGGVRPKYDTSYEQINDAVEKELGGILQEEEEASPDPGKKSIRPTASSKVRVTIIGIIVEATIRRESKTLKKFAYEVEEE
mgnify:FL=1